MGDRTFSAEDVIRIYQDFLTFEEQRIVDEFFEQEPDESLLPFNAVRNLLALLDPLLSILAGPLIGALAAVFGALTLTSLNASIRALRGTNRILGNILEREEVDA